MRGRRLACGLCLAALLAVGCRGVVAPLAGAPEIDAAELGRALAGAAPPVVLDVRPAPDYRQGHVPGALTVPFAALDGYLAAGRVPAGREVVTVCDRGNRSALAVPKVRAWGVARVASLRGGLEAWEARGLPVARDGGAGSEPSPAPPIVRLTTFEQIVVTASGGVIKPAYMLLALVLIVWLWRARARDLALVRWGLVAFLAGEAICALDFFFGAAVEAAPLDFLHGLGMIGMGALVPWGLFHLVDDRVLRFGDPDERCVVQRLCGHCWKREQVSCGLKRLFLLLAPALAVCALIPLAVPLRAGHHVSPVFLSQVPYGMPVLNQIVEFRIYPVLGAVLLLVATWRLRGGPASIGRAEAPFFLGLGVTSFALVRFFLSYAFREAPLWSDFWEELTELCAIVALGMILLVFRAQLGLGRRRAAAPPAEVA
ncbi:MAG TPA: rhodanese-like domain-containing protein [Polyangia bacterium]|jgi:rhodanese-related sulfurtransferase